ncbi:MAG: GGDEF domain-containing protein, partial [Acidobacteriota bacterium]
YRSRWFQLFAILAAALLGAGLLHMQNRGRLKRKAWLEEEVKQRTSDLDSANRQIQEQNRQLTELSRTDPLTGLGNRRALADVLPVEMSILKREVIRLGPGDNIGEYHAAVVMMIDLDHFKAINDRWGHDVGDRALERCGDVLSDEMRECDQAVRWGGEEFVILARGMDREGALGFAQRILDRFNNCHIEGPDGTVIPIRASFGFLQIPLGTTDFQSSDQWPRLIDVADRLMYLAKVQGRARSIGLVWGDGGLPDVSARKNCENLLRDIAMIPDSMEMVELEPSIDA